MDSATLRQEDEDDEEYQEAYWRRRVIALGAVVLVVGGLAWGCSGDGDEKEAAAKKEKPAASPSPSPVPTVSGSGGASLAIPTVMVTVTQTATVAAPRRRGDVCAARDVVATLTPTVREFAPGVQPSFRLTVVNTGDLDCTFDVGAQKLVARIKSGSDRIWSSAHCDVTEGSSIQMLRRGIPYATTLVWDRRRSGKGCDGPRAKALPGTYAVQAQGGGVKTEKSVFVLQEGGRGSGR
ncbi:hypothetical protein ABGB12_19925 [Actinocorallia sp. B10E7]|uniref:hypothetical protein n=1 Tax=Actinocorallia sp. B10E7 TaxID=3153558 RepID=UPI00325CA62F